MGFRNYAQFHAKFTDSLRNSGTICGSVISVLFEYKLINCSVMQHITTGLPSVINSDNRLCSHVFTVLEFFEK